MNRSSQTLLVFLALLAPAAAQFETRTTVPTIEATDSIAVGDFNHDGKLDMAVAPFEGDDIMVMLGKGDGTFQSPVNYNLGTGIGPIAAADLTGNGNLDLAVVAAPGIVILLGNGDGTFRSGGSYAVANDTYFVATADFNNDHIPDLVMTNYPSVTVMLGNGDGTFQSPISFNPPYGDTVLGVGDFNRDGKLDLAVASGNFQVQIFLGNGDGTFQAGGVYDVDESPSSVAVGDFRGDGKLDLAVACSLGGEVAVLLGNGDGTFQPETSYPTPYPYWVATADLNGDGKLDLAVANFDLVTAPLTVASVLLGEGDGTFQNAANYPTGRTSRNLAIGDFNEDGKPDLAVTDDSDMDVFVLLNTGVVSLSPTTPIVFPPQLLNTESDVRTVRLTNKGSTALTISSMSVQGEYELSDTCGKSVAPGAGCSVNVRSAPTTIGALSGTVTIRDSASSKPQVIELSGAGTVVELKPSSLDFAPQVIHTKSEAKNVQLTNTGSAALSISGVYVEGANWTSFSQINNCGSSVASGATCTVAVTFDPVKRGSLKASLDIYDSGGGTFQSVALSGTGN